MIRSSVTFYILIFSSCLFFNFTVKSVDKVRFFNAFSSTNATVVKKELEHLKNLSFVEKEAYTGALMMKMAGLEGGVTEKLKNFTEGKKKLENGITKDKNNIEYRFLRIVIQENCPIFLNYSSNVEEDARFIKNNFNSLESELKKFVLDYKPKSENLKKAGL
ncbi:MAG: hypothetical protein H6605_04805 [Flavobacteriales bacterium]|nr:hypothetical protein [Flavobacteriales bacterium]